MGIAHRSHEENKNLLGEKSQRETDKRNFSKEEISRLKEIISSHKF